MLRSFLIVILFVTSAVAQDSDSINLPEPVMRQIVDRIVRYKFKSPRSPRTIPIGGAGIRPAWLPTISNITFKLVKDDEAFDSVDGVFLFDDIERKGDTYSINVGWGDFDCFAYGDTWRFTVKGERVRLWPRGEAWGRGCGSGGNTPPVVRGLKLGDVSPNELPGYEFSTKGKLKGIRLGISTRADVKRIFGDTCESRCDDGDWSVSVNYFENNEGGTITTYSGDDVSETEYKPKQEIVGTVESVELTPNKPIPFATVVFSRAFGRSQSNAIGDDFDENGFAGAVHTKVDRYTDGYGLTYEIYNAETFNNLKHPKPEKDPAKKGDLIGIEYGVPASLEDKIYNKTLRPRTKK